MSKMQIKVDRDNVRKIAKLKVFDPTFSALPVNRIANILINDGLAVRNGKTQTRTEPAPA